MNLLMSAGVDTMPPVAQATEAVSASLTSWAGWPRSSEYPCR